MKRIGSIIDMDKIEAMVERMANDMERQRQAGIHDFGWAEDCECHECGDTGVNPHTKSVCWCEVGRVMQTRRELEKSWPLRAPGIHVNSRLDTHPTEAARRCGQDWLDNDYPVNVGMVISGNVGSGKTGLAVALAHAVHMTGKRVLISTFTEILDGMRPQAANGSPETVPTDMYKPALLVLDDLGTQKVTEFVSERLFAIVDGRHQRQLPTIITTNLGLQELKDRFGDRVVSRIVEVSRFVTLTGTDLRYRKARAA